jgi:hypothetical protein
LVALTLDDGAAHGFGGVVSTMAKRSLDNEWSTLFSEPESFARKIASEALVDQIGKIYLNYVEFRARHRNDV